MKVGIVIIVYNLPIEIFLLQISAIKKFCKDEDYTIEIFDNSTDVVIAESIEYQAGLLELSYRKTVANSQNGSDSHSWAANLAYHKLKDSYGQFLFLDHDCIPVIEFSIEQTLGEYVMAGVGQGAKKKYLWPGSLFINSKAIDKDIIDFAPSHKFNLDSGGNLYLTIEKYGADKCIFFNEAYLQNPFFVDSQYGYFSVINNGMFYHFVNGSNWAGAKRHEERVNSFINIIREKTGL